MTSAAPPALSSRWTLDLVFAGAVLLCCVLPYLLGSSGLVLAAALPLPAVVLRRHYPPIALAAGVAGALGQLVLASQPVLSIVVVPLLVFSAARHSSQLGRAALIAGLVGSVVGPVRWTVAGSYGNSVAALLVLAVACAGVVTAAYLVGSRQRESQRAAEQERSAEEERQALRVAEAEQRFRVQSTWERNRIARELHDIVAHSLSVIVVQAEGGQAAAVRTPERAPEVLATIAETGREALAEMRRMVALLRSESEADSADYAPSPGFADIADLVRKTDPDAQLVVFGTPPDTSAAISLTAYRVVQEALTNVLKHGGPVAHTRVTLAYAADSVEIEVVDDGRGAAVESDGTGVGLRGMAERVEVLGGTLTAQPRSGGGFGVRASLPLAASSTSPGSAG